VWSDTLCVWSFTSIRGEKGYKAGRI